MQRLKLPELARIDRDPTYGAALGQLIELEQRVAETEQRRQRAKARLRRAKPPGTPLERTKKLLAGGQIGAADPLADLKAADEENSRSCGRRWSRRTPGWTRCTVAYRSPRAKSCGRITRRRCTPDCRP
jgi:hypothetical protein